MCVPIIFVLFPGSARRPSPLRGGMCHANAQCVILILIMPSYAMIFGGV